MRNLQIKDVLTNSIFCEAMCGCSFDECVKEAKDISKTSQKFVRFDFHGVCINVDKNTDSDLLWRDFQNAISLNLFDKIGPNPEKEYPNDLKEKIERLSKERDEKLRISQEKHRQEQENKRLKLFEKISNIEIEIFNESEYNDWKNKNTDSYGNAAFVYSEYWMKLMQYEKKYGKNIQDIITETSHEADIEGITGFMFGCAKQIIRKYWKYSNEITNWESV